MQADTKEVTASPEDRQSESNLDVLMDIELPVMVRFGCTKMQLGDLAKTTTGSLIAFAPPTENMVDVLVNGRVVARGSAVVVNGNYGVRIADVVSGRERIAIQPVLAPSESD